MNYSAANTALWGPVIQIGLIAGAILVANTMRRKIKFFQKSLMPTAVLAGFLLLILRSFNVINLGASFLETLTYHALALGFIAQSLRIPEKQAEDSDLAGLKSGALIVSTYMLQVVLGLTISVVLMLTVKPDLFPASGILLAMALDCYMAICDPLIHAIIFTVQKKVIKSVPKCIFCRKKTL